MVSFQDNGIGEEAIGLVGAQERELKGGGRLRTVSLGRGLVV